MPTFDTPQPVTVAIEVGVGHLRIEAADRTDTVVEVRPKDPTKKGDVAAAEQTRVDYAHGRLTIKGPKGRRTFSLRGGGDAIDVHVALPAGSALRTDAGIAHLRASGPLGECRVKAGVGGIRVDEAGPVHITLGAGDVTVGLAREQAEVTTGSGDVRIESIDGSAVVRNSNGATSIGEVTGDLRVKAANGKIVVGRAGATVAAKTANGDIRLGEVARGVVVAETAYGKVEVGVADGVAAWLDLGTGYGMVHNELDTAERPGAGEPTVEIRAKSGMGDITVRRPSRLEAPTP
jgi:hypothetical protein